MPYRINKPAFLVEGDLEQKFIQSICPGAPVRKIGCNGVDVDIAEIARRVGTQARLLQRRHNPIVVVFDREGRPESCEQIEQKLREHLSTEGLDGDIIIGIPNRNIETWILADFERFIESAGLQPEMTLESSEGANGKSRIKTILNGTSSYVETVHGVAWLKNARPSIMQKRSESFEKFYRPLVDLGCWWLAQGELDLESTSCTT